MRGGKSLEQTTERYFQNCEAVVEICKHIDPEDVLIVRHEDLIYDTKGFLRAMNYFIGVEPYDDYLDACASIIFKTPAKSREKIRWDDASIGIIENRIDKYGFLSGYSFEN